MNKLSLLLIFLFFLMPGILFCQQSPFDQAQLSGLLLEKGITPQELQTKLNEKGVDLRKYNASNPADIAAVQKEIQTAIEEIEAERSSSNENSSSNDSGVKKEELDEVIKDEPIEIESQNIDALLDESEEEGADTQLGEEEKKDIINEERGDIEKAVNDGATIEEAIAEEISEELQEKLPPAKTWGQQIFRDKKISVYQQSRDVKPPSSYVLGPGDRIAVSIWGFSQENVIFEINDDGYIKPDRMPRITLKGIPFGKARELLRSRFSNYYRFRPEEFEVTLNFSRTITVNVVGEVFNYGSFTLPARNTAFNALVATGGPTDYGSVRNIQLIRSGEKPKTIDVYEFLLNPSAEDKLFLQENDYIYVPDAENVVRIGGAVRRPFRYEMTNAEGLKELIKYAGGLKISAYTDVVQIIRNHQNEQKLINVNFSDILNGKSEDIRFEHGDSVYIKAISQPIKNRVYINGPVITGGWFELDPKMRLIDLVNKAGLRDVAKLDVAQLTRYNIDGTTEIELLRIDSAILSPNSSFNIELQNNDRVSFYSVTQFLDTRGANVVIDGAVRYPRKIPYDYNGKLTVSKLIEISGGLRKDALDTAYIHRRDPYNPAIQELIKINLSNAIEDESSTDNILFSPYDSIYVFSELPRYSSYSISITGGVRNNLNIDFKPNLKINDLVYLSGGLTKTSTGIGYIERVDPLRPGFKEYIRVDAKQAERAAESPSNVLLKPQDKVVIYTRETYVDRFNVSIQGEVRKPGTFELGNSLRAYDLLEMAGGLTMRASQFAYIESVDPTNPDIKTYKSLNIQDLANNPNSNDNIFLSPNDNITIYPKTRYTDGFQVDIKGEVREPGTFQAGQGLTVKDAVLLAGGLKFEASRLRVELYRLQFDMIEGSSTILIPLELNDEMEVIGQPSSFSLLPFDQLFIRQIPDLDMIESVELIGEITYPGDYPLVSKNERVIDIIQRAGGITSQSFPAGARLYRNTGEESGLVVMKLHKILKGDNGKKRSRYNFLLKPGDRIEIPRRKDIVTLFTENTNAPKYMDVSLIQGGKINVAHAPRKKANFYIKEYLGGDDKVGRKNKIAVVHPNGRMKKTFAMFGFIRFYPKVEKGSVVMVGAKPPKTKTGNGFSLNGFDSKRERLAQFIQETVATTTATLSMILLLRELGQ